MPIAMQLSNCYNWSECGKKRKNSIPKKQELVTFFSDNANIS